MENLKVNRSLYIDADVWKKAKEKSAKSMSQLIEELLGKFVKDEIHSDYQTSTIRDSVLHREK